MAHFDVLPITVYNVIVFILFAVDKYCSKKHSARVPEAVLLVLSFFFGAVGAMFGMIVWNHKTSKIVFRILVPLFVVFNYIMMYDSYRVVKLFLTFILGILPK